VRDEPHWLGAHRDGGLLDDDVARELATRTGEIGAYAVLAIATTIVAVSAWVMALTSGQLSERLVGFQAGMLYALATGIALTIAVSSLFRALSLGPASVVVPIYGMFILGGAALGIAFLQEALTMQKVIGRCRWGGFGRILRCSPAAWTKVTRGAVCGLTTVRALWVHA
jgi:transporter family protein